MSTNDAQRLGMEGRCALIVDDSRAIRAMLRRLLSSLGFDVVEAGNGVEGLEALRTTPHVDLALVDWNMPVMDGLSFLKELRAEREYADIVVLMVTSESDPSKVARALMKGADDYVIKPLTPEVLTAKLEMLDTWRPSPHGGAEQPGGGEHDDVQPEFEAPLTAAGLSAEQPR